MCTGETNLRQFGYRESQECVRVLVIETGSYGMIEEGTISSERLNVREVALAKEKNQELKKVEFWVVQLQIAVEGVIFLNASLYLKKNKNLFEGG